MLFILPKKRPRTTHDQDYAANDGPLYGHGSVGLQRSSVQHASGFPLLRCKTTTTAMTTFKL
jgi:hypothetical protein